eukprot:m.124750 g.124750  ORF g.124750 m.124750 type:complete len:81 (+) comp13782_c0_seq1:765-1007(+)
MLLDNGKHALVSESQTIRFWFSKHSTTHASSENASGHLRMSSTACVSVVAAVLDAILALLLLSLVVLQLDALMSLSQLRL